MKNNRFVSIFLVMVFLFSLNSYEAQAKWDDKSDELPGMTSDKEMTALLVVAGVAVTGLVVLLIIKKKQKKELESTSFNSSGIKSLGFADIKKPTSLYDQMNQAAEQVPVQFIAGCNSFQNQRFCNKQVISVGVRIRF